MKYDYTGGAYQPATATITDHALRITLLDKRYGDTITLDLPRGLVDGIVRAAAEHLYGKLPGIGEFGNLSLADTGEPVVITNVQRGDYACDPCECGGSPRLPQLQPEGRELAVYVVVTFAVPIPAELEAEWKAQGIADQAMAAIGMSMTDTLNRYPVGNVITDIFTGTATDDEVKRWREEAESSMPVPPAQTQPLTVVVIDQPSLFPPNIVNPN